MAPAEISDERLERLAQAPLVELIMACEDLDNAAEVIAENDYMWDRLCRDVADRSSAISSEDTAEEVCRTFLQQIERYARLGKGPVGDEEDLHED